MLVDKSSNDVVGAMYTQRVKDGELLDLAPWEESIATTVGIEGCSIDPNIDCNGMVKQLMRVSTQGGGGDAKKTHVPGTSLRDFALIVAASQGIDQVVSVAISTSVYYSPQQIRHLSSPLLSPLLVCNHTCQ